MKTFQLNAEPRTDLGKKAAKALRASQKIPCVLNGGKVVELKDGKYDGTLAQGEKVVEIGRDGKAVITTDFTVNFSDVRKLIYTPDVYVVALNLNGVEKMAVLKDIQWHPVNDSILHLDFLEVTNEKPVVVPVPVKVEGHAAGVKAGGKLFLSMKKVKVKGIYTDIPERIVVNVDNIAIGHAIKVGDLKFDKFELANAKDLVITGVRATRAAAAAAAETEEGEENAAAAE
ncbi:MAG: 50S ribosomal protein L25 [Muribaculaceae bacterium]|jgi:large subunit ribosomal protein L25|nr:50S ribosomal protein L25 [Muribaculaceae bacterium]MBQ6648227.1 50S ribosomal protein L25 [Muribaculaceae bacterium]